MNTFLPSPDFQVCAKVLDPARLNRQISEVTGLARTLWVYTKILEVNDRQIPWGVTFPLAVKLWISNEGSPLLLELMQYHRAMNQEYCKISGKDHESFKRFNWPALLVGQPKIPRKLVWPASVHESHRSKLIAKEAGYYRVSFSRAGLSIPQVGLSYVWEGPTVERDPVQAAS